jgi:2-dehydropantoate 2-reductase
MKFLIMGTGAVGSVFGGLLAENSQDVTLIGRENYINAIRTGGLQISGIWGEHHIANLKCYTAVKDIAAVDFDAVLLTTKSFDTETAVKAVLPLIGEKTLVVSLQNGLGNIETIASLIGEKRTIGGRVIFGIELVRPGHFKVSVIADKVLIGAISSETSVDKLNEIAVIINRAGIPTATTDNIHRFIWLKVLYNCCLNAPSAILDTIYGRLGEFEPSRAIIRAIIAEVLAVARSRGIDLGFPDAAAYEAVFYAKLLPPTYAHHSSTLQDIRVGKKTEIEALNGAIVRLGGEKSIPAPVNWTLTQLIHAREELNGRP